MWGASIYSSESVDLPYKYEEGFLAYHNNVIQGFPAVLIGLGLILMGIAIHFDGFWTRMERTRQFAKRAGTIVMWPGVICICVGLGIVLLH